MNSRSWLLVGAAGTSLGFGLGRALAETFYLSLDWLAAWPGSVLLAAAIALLTLALWRWGFGRNAAVFIPLFLPLVYVFFDGVSLLQAYTCLLGSVLLTAVFVGFPARGRLQGTLLVIITLGVYLGTLGRTVGQADTFEFQIVAYKLGIAHPTGYPLYLLLGKLFTLLPVGSVAWRVNLLSAVCAAGAALLLFLILQQLLAFNCKPTGIQPKTSKFFAPSGSATRAFDCQPDDTCICHRRCKCKVAGALYAPAGLSDARPRRFSSRHSLNLIPTRSAPIWVGCALPRVSGRQLQASFGSQPANLAGRAKQRHSHAAQRHSHAAQRHSHAAQRHSHAAQCHSHSAQCHSHSAQRNSPPAQRNITSEQSRGQSELRAALSLLGALAFALSPTLWSQAVEAEVYALNSLLVAFILWTLVKLFQPSAQGAAPPHSHPGGWLHAGGMAEGQRGHRYQATAAPPSVPPAALAGGMFCSPPACGGSWRGAISVLDGDYSENMPPPNPTPAGGRVRGVLGLIHMVAKGQRAPPSRNTEKTRASNLQPPTSNLHSLFLALGFSLANHLTTVILFPAVALALLLARPRLPRKSWAVAALLFLVGLSLYLYLPIRWPAVHNGALMPLRVFVDWVMGGRFQGALHLDAWRSDPTRYAIVGRLALEQWGWPGVGLAAVGLLWLWRQNWQVALITIITWLGYAFYALSFYIPDIAVFLIPAHLVMALWMGCGVWGIVRLGTLAPTCAGRRPGSAGVGALAVTLFALLPLNLVIQHWPVVDRSAPNPLEAWGRRVLSLDLDYGAAILADSEKIAPLYYLQQTERLRPDLEIMVLPDEASYRAELDTRVAAGQTVYLARFLPGLEGIYHLRSVAGAAGPLVQVSSHPLTAAPPLDGRLDAPFGPHVTLLGYTAAGWQAAYPDPFRLTLYWTTSAPVDDVYQVWLRLVDDVGEAAWQSKGAHPAGDSYPTSAWRPGEIIPDAHQISIPPGLPPAEYHLQTALLVPFGNTGLMPDNESGPWLSIGTLQVRPPAARPAPQQTVRIWTDGVVISGLDAPPNARPGAELSLVLYAAGDRAAPLHLAWDNGPQIATNLQYPVSTIPLPILTKNGDHTLFILGNRPLRCGWLHRPAEHCPLAQITIQGAALPAGAANFDDLIALLATDAPNLTLRPGGTLELTLTWQALAPIKENYTVFLHVLDPAGQIVGQVDIWPVQGTYPTSQWPAGRPITDHYRIPIVPDAPPGAYRLEIGWYLLRTMQRLYVLGANGNPVDNRVLLEGVVVLE